MNRFNSEDMRDHRTAALAVGTGKYLFSINLKHRMVTFPIGKCRPNEGLLDGLIREMYEELGIMLQVDEFSNEPYCKFTKIYDFAGTPVKIENSVFLITGGYGEHICNRATNKEPDKCGGLFVATIDDAINIAKSTGLKIADCVMFYKRFRSER